MACTVRYTYTPQDLPASFRCRRPLINLSRYCSFGTAVQSEEKLSESEESANVLYLRGSAGDQLSLPRTQD